MKQTNIKIYFRFFIIVSATMLMSACDNYPKDSRHALDKIQTSGILIVGVIEQPPWAKEIDDELSGIDIDIIKQFADSLKVKPQWHVLSESQAADQLEHYQLDIVVGGLTENNPRKDKIAFTRPYLKLGDSKKQHHIMALTKGENQLLTTLETYLRTNQSSISARYQEAEK